MKLNRGWHQKLKWNHKVLDLVKKVNFLKEDSLLIKTQEDSKPLIRGSLGLDVGSRG